MQVTEPSPGHVNITCECGKPISVADKYGMFCEDLCNREASVRIAKSLGKMFDCLPEGMFESISLDK